MPLHPDLPVRGALSHSLSVSSLHLYLPPSLLYLPLLSMSSFPQALRIHTRGVALDADVDLDALAASCERFTGAELEVMCREAALAALREDRGAAAVGARHFAAARAAAAPALSPAQLAGYMRFGKLRGQKLPASAGAF